jgi:hypothetical protein
MLNRLDAMKINSYLFDAQQAVRKAGRDLEYGTEEYKDNNEEYYAIGLLRAKMDVIEAEVRLKEARD